jgi:hypothetical protein
MKMINWVKCRSYRVVVKYFFFPRSCKNYILATLCKSQWARSMLWLGFTTWDKQRLDIAV